MRDNPSTPLGDKRALVCFLCSFFAVALVTLAAGCETPRRVVDTFRGDLIVEERINVEQSVDQPRLVATNWFSVPGVLYVDLEQERLSAFDLELRYEKVNIVRTVDPEAANQANKDNLVENLFLRPLDMAMN